MRRRYWILDPRATTCNGKNDPVGVKELAKAADVIFLLDDEHLSDRAVRTVLFAGRHIRFRGFGFTVSHETSTRRSCPIMAAYVSKYAHLVGCTGSQDLPELPLMGVSIESGWRAGVCVRSCGCSLYIF